MAPSRGTAAANGGADADTEALIDSILSARRLYDVLGVPPAASAEDIRRAYVARSKRVHPDKCHLPRATEAFQVLCHAYKTLYSPESRRRYDLTGEGEGGPSGSASAERTFTSVTSQLLAEFMGGNFGNILRLIELLNAMTLRVPLDKDRVTSVLQQAQAAATQLQDYLDRVKFDAARLAELQDEFRRQRWSNVTGQALLAAQMGRTAAGILVAAPWPPLWWLQPVPWLLRATAGGFAVAERALAAVHRHAGGLGDAVSALLLPALLPVLQLVAMAWRWLSSAAAAAAAPFRSSAPEAASSGHRQRR